MKDPRTWEEADLYELIKARAEESTTLEFKDPDALRHTDRKKTEISKDVSAFANTIGGTLVYGILEGEAESHQAAALKPVDPNEFSKESLDQIINSRIQPRLDSVVVRPIEAKTQTQRGYVFVVHIPESTTAHQASDRRYYKRFNFQSVPMEDYEVRYAMNRACRPSYEIKLERSIGSGPAGQVVTVRCIVHNDSEIAGHDVSTALYVPTHRLGQKRQGLVEFSGEPHVVVAGIAPSTSYAPPEMAVACLPPFAGINFRFDHEISVSAERDHQPVFGIRVYDGHGLALTAKFGLQIPNFDPNIIQKGAGFKRRATHNVPQTPV